MSPVADDRHLRGGLIGHPLTPREIEIMVRYARGSSQREVARDLGIERQTVKNTLSTIYAKLGVGSILGAMYAQGWVHIPSDAELLTDSLGQRWVKLAAEVEELVAEARALTAGLAKYDITRKDER